MQRRLIELSDNEAHVWYAWTRECGTSDLLRYYRSLLSADERNRYERLAFEELKREYLVTRGLCRLILSRYVDVPPADWAFRTNPYGRPEVDTERVDTPIRFNLSNTRMLVACAVTLNASVGVDVEVLNKDIPVLGIAESYLARSEFETLKELSTSDRHRRFFEFWTLKEAYIKAHGMGLSMSLDTFSFELRDGKIRVTFDPDVEDSTDHWQFALDYIGTDHVLAVGISKKCSHDYSIAIQQAPLRALVVGHAPA